MIRSIMTIDDDKLHHKLIDIFIKRSGKIINHYPFQDALEAYQYLLNNNIKAFLPDIILLDLDMPFSGWSFLEVFQTISPGLKKQIDVIILTSSINTNDKAKAESYTCVRGYFSKPFNQFLLKDIEDASFLSEYKTGDFKNNQHDSKTHTLQFFTSAEVSNG